MKHLFLNFEPFCYDLIKGCTISYSINFAFLLIVKCVWIELPIINETYSSTHGFSIQRTHGGSLTSQYSTKVINIVIANFVKVGQWLKHSSRVRASDQEVACSNHGGCWACFLSSSSPKTCFLNMGPISRCTTTIFPFECLAVKLNMLQT